MEECIWKIMYFKEVHIQRDAEQALVSLRVEPGAGPDLLPTRILKHCGDTLARHLKLLTSQIIETGNWPELWLLRWIVPLHKKRNNPEPRL